MPPKRTEISLRRVKKVILRWDTNCIHMRSCVLSTLCQQLIVMWSANWSFFSDKTNVIASSCKIHNDASCDISSDGKLLATFVPSAQGFPDDGVVSVYSLEKSTLGQCVFSKKFGEIFHECEFFFHFSVTRYAGWRGCAVFWSRALGSSAIRNFCHSRSMLQWSVFNHVASSHANLLDQKEVLHKKRVPLPQDWFGTPMWPP